MTLRQRFKILFTGKLPSAPKRTAISLEPYANVTLSSWRRSSERIGYANQLWRDPTWRELVAVLANTRILSHPYNLAHEQEAAFHLGMRHAQDTLIALLLSLRELEPEAPEEVEADYGADVNALLNK